MRLLGSPTLVRPDDVGDVAQGLADTFRRGLVFVAGSYDSLPQGQWKDMVAGLLRETAGLAVQLVLDPAATVAFNALVGPAHAVAPGTVRTFVSGVRFGDPEDYIRHRILGTERIVREDGRYLALLLGRRARAATADTALSTQVTRLDRRLRTALDEVVLEEMFAAPITALPAPDAELLPPELAPRDTITEPVSTAPPVPAPRPRPAHDSTVDTGPGVVPEPVPAAAGPAAAGPAVPAYTAPDTGELAAQLNPVLLAIFGTTELTRDRARMIAEFATASARADATREYVFDRLSRAEALTDDLREQTTTLRTELEDEQQERALAELGRLEVSRRLRHAQQQLASTGHSEAAWAVPDTDEQDVPPGSFDELLDRVDSLPRVVFTGNHDTTRGLDEHNVLGSWAARAWEALLALVDYAAETAGGRCPRDVEGYLADTPAYLHGFSLGRHASGETATLASNRRYSAPRTLPVPKQVSPDGAIFMGAHFKIAQSGMLSPRMHYYDDTARSGNVYIGYLGPHLLSDKTN